LADARNNNLSIVGSATPIFFRSRSKKLLRCGKIIFSSLAFFEIVAPAASAAPPLNGRRCAKLEYRVLAQAVRVVAVLVATDDLADRLRQKFIIRMADVTLMTTIRKAEAMRLVKPIWRSTPRNRPDRDRTKSHRRRNVSEHCGLEWMSSGAALG
jgi:hypothetical protein